MFDTTLLLLLLLTWKVSTIFPSSFNFFFSLHSFLHEMSFDKKGVSSWCYMACLFYHCGAEEAPFVMNEFIHEQCWGDVENMSHNISWIMICIYIFKHLAFAINASYFRMSPTNKVRKLKGRYSTTQKKEVCLEQNTPNKLNRHLAWPFTP